MALTPDPPDAHANVVCEQLPGLHCYEVQLRNIWILTSLDLRNTAPNRSGSFLESNKYIGVTLRSIAANLYANCYDTKAQRHEGATYLPWAQSDLLAECAYRHGSAASSTQYWLTAT